MYRIILLFVFMLFCFTPLCYAEELPVDILIRGVNQARLTIQSGEVQTQTTREYAAQNTEVEIAAWIQSEREQALKHISPDVDVKQYENDYLLPSLNAMANRFRKHTKHEHTTTLFQVLEQSVGSRPRLYQYKLTNVDTPGYPLDKMSDRFSSSDTLILLAYDMQIQVREGIGDIRFSVSNSTIDDSDLYGGYSYFSVWGRSHFHVPTDAKLIGKETIDNVECYGLAFIAPDKRKVRIWIDPAKDFCVRRIDYYHPTIETKMPYTRITYKKFKKYEDVWLPLISEDTVYLINGKMASRATTEVITVELNVDFPKDFFKINKEYYKPSDSDTEDHSEQGNSSTPPVTSTDTILLLCGPQSLSRICKLLKVDTNLSELKKLSGFTPDRGTTMIGLKTAADYKGLAPTGIKATVELLRRNKVPLPAIAYVDDNHFLVFESVNKTGVKITDPAQKYESPLTWDKLSDIWYGELLIFDKKKRQCGNAKQVPLALNV